jgi:hypothetical protein
VLARIQDFIRPSDCTNHTALQLTVPHESNSGVDGLEASVETLTLGSTTCQHKNGTFPILTAKGIRCQQLTEFGGAGFDGIDASRNALAFGMWVARAHVASPPSSQETRNTFAAESSCFASMADLFPAKKLTGVGLQERNAFEHGKSKIVLTSAIRAADGAAGSQPSELPRSELPQRLAKYARHRI